MFGGEGGDDEFIEMWGVAEEEYGRGVFVLSQLAKERGRFGAGEK